jgi:hypothetical protein
MRIVAATHAEGSEMARDPVRALGHLGERQYRFGAGRPKPAKPEPKRII